jgi:hypothetical protein
MQITKLDHKHGGQIVSIDAITHGKYSAKAPAYYEFIGRVKWHDGTESAAAHIAPICIATADGSATDEYLAVMELLNVYLAENGVRKRPSYEWVPKRPTGYRAIP